MTYTDVFGITIFNSAR